jgi:hypothetical protein
LVETELREALEAAAKVADGYLLDVIRQTQDCFLSPGSYEARSIASGATRYSDDHPDEGPEQP